MSTVVIDIYRLVDLLKQRGFNEQQPTGIVEAIQDIDLDHLVTKHDLKVEMAALRQEFSVLKTNIFKWLVPILLGQAALTAALVQLFN